MHNRALVLTVSDGVSAGSRDDLSGELLERLLAKAGYDVDRDVLSDDRALIAARLQAASAEGYDLVVTTGGTGFGPRDVTPEATLDVVEREASGLTHLILAEGIKSTPFAALSRARAGTVGKSLIINLPGSPKGAEESITAILDLIPHALDLINGQTEHGSA